MDALRLNEIKKLFKQIFDYLSRVGIKIEQMDEKLSGIPNLDILSGLERRVKNLEFRADTVDSNLTLAKTELSSEIKDNFKTTMDKFKIHEKRIKALEDEVDDVKSCLPDWTTLATKEDI